MWALKYGPRVVGKDDRTRHGPGLCPTYYIITTDNRLVCGSKHTVRKERDRVTYECCRDTTPTFIGIKYLSFGSDSLHDLSIVSTFHRLHSNSETIKSGPRTRTLRERSHLLWISLNYVPLFLLDHKYRGTQNPRL